jgi:hypothetical protein
METTLLESGSDRLPCKFQLRAYYPQNSSEDGREGATPSLLQLLQPQHSGQVSGPALLGGRPGLRLTIPGTQQQAAISAHPSNRCGLRGASLYQWENSQLDGAGRRPRLRPGPLCARAAGGVGGLACLLAAPVGEEECSPPHLLTSTSCGPGSHFRCWALERPLPAHRGTWGRLSWGRRPRCGAAHAARQVSSAGWAGSGCGPGAGHSGPGQD